MKNARLTRITIENFKSFARKTTVPIKPLTVIVGRNNSGKSTLIQSLLLLKQTLGDPRQDIALKLDGIVEAFSLRELTFGWPKNADVIKGPLIVIEWSSTVDVVAAYKKANNPDRANLALYSGITWLKNLPDELLVDSTLKIHTMEYKGSARISELEMTIKVIGKSGSYTLRVLPDEHSWFCEWNGVKAQKIRVEFDHFIPYLHIERKRIGPRHTERAWHNAYLILFQQPLEALKQILLGIHFLGSSRSQPRSLFRPATTDPEEIGASGEFAAQMLHRNKDQRVHFLQPIHLLEDGLDFDTTVHAASMIEAINRVMKSMSVTTSLKVKDIEEIGFQLKFGEANLMHVGRGLSFLLPLVQLGLFADPLRFTGGQQEMSLAEYQERCATISHIALEEPEAHLHPKVQSRLAHFFVSLAMAGRQLIVETHSDHLVRRLRGLAVRAESNGFLERWLLENVVILHVSQEDGRSSVEACKLTAEGSVAEKWPADFMDESTDEESAIYYARLDKTAPYENDSSIRVLDGEEPEEEAVP